jgi:hypothetical protein
MFAKCQRRTFLLRRLDNADEHTNSSSPEDVHETLREHRPVETLPSIRTARVWIRLRYDSSPRYSASSELKITSLPEDLRVERGIDQTRPITMRPSLDIRESV